jgi:hypothetical protein
VVEAAIVDRDGLIDREREHFRVWSAKEKR